jgi:tyrosyl-tRNA synthetase
MENIPTTEIPGADFGAGMDILSLLKTTKLIPSTSEGRRLIQQGGVRVNDVKIESHEHIVQPADFAEGHALVQKGKKIFMRVKLT